MFQDSDETHDYMKPKRSRLKEKTGILFKYGAIEECERLYKHTKSEWERFRHYQRQTESFQYPVNETRQNGGVHTVVSHFPT